MRTVLGMSLLPAELRWVTSDADLSTVLADSLYAGYLESQKSAIDRLHQHDFLRIPSHTIFSGISGL